MSVYERFKCKTWYNLFYVNPSCASFSNVSLQEGLFNHCYPWSNCLSRRLFPFCFLCSNQWPVRLQTEVVLFLAAEVSGNPDREVVVTLWNCTWWCTPGSGIRLQQKLYSLVNWTQKAGRSNWIVVEVLWVSHLLQASIPRSALGALSNRYETENRPSPILCYLACLLTSVGAALRFWRSND